LKSVESNRKRPRNQEFNHLLTSTWAYLYQKQNQLEPMLPYLRRAIELAPKKVIGYDTPTILAQALKQLVEMAKLLPLTKRFLK